MKGFAKDDKCILFGIIPTLTTTTVSLTEGWMYWGDALWYCPAQSESVVSGTRLEDIWISKKTTTDFSVLMEDGNTEPIYQYNTLTLPNGATTIPQNLLTLDLLAEYRLKSIMLPAIEIASMTLENGWSVSFGSSFHIKKVLGNVTVQGNLTGSVTQGGVKVGTLPIGFRPLSECYFMCRTGVATVYEVRIGVNGDVYIDGTSGTISVSFNFTFINN
ncbi:MAG: hypothetical protein HC803_06065 [Saprospiraceae bacterium]|nr:hypothetical protein [Saprospiraceae bacterium]